MLAAHRTASCLHCDRLHAAACSLIHSITYLPAQVVMGYSCNEARSVQNPISRGVATVTAGRLVISATTCKPTCQRPKAHQRQRRTHVETPGYSSQTAQNGHWASIDLGWSCKSTPVQSNQASRRVTTLQHHYDVCIICMTTDEGMAEPTKHGAAHHLPGQAKCPSPADICCVPAVSATVARTVDGATPSHKPRLVPSNGLSHPGSSPDQSLSCYDVRVH